MGEEPTGGEHSEERFTVLVALGEPEHVPQLMRTAIDLARDRNGVIELVSVVHRPSGSPFRLFEEEHLRESYADHQRAILDRAVQLAEAASVPVDRSMPVGANIAETILEATRRVDADALLLGWEERSRASNLVLGTTVDPLVRRAGCRVYVERIGTTAERVESVLLPTDGGPNARAAVDLATAIARANDARLDLVTFLAPEAETSRETRARESLETIVREVEDLAIETAIERSDSVAEAIISAASDNDIVVLGATRERRFQQRVVGSVARAVGARIEAPVVIAREAPDPSRWRRLWPW